MSEKTILISVGRRAIICGFTGRKGDGIRLDKSYFFSGHILGPYLEEKCNIRQSTYCILICILRSYEGKCYVVFDNEARRIVRRTRIN